MIRRPINSFIRRFSHSHSKSHINNFNHKFKNLNAIDYDAWYKSEDFKNKIGHISNEIDKINIKQDKIEINIQEISVKNNKIQEILGYSAIGVFSCLLFKLFF